MKKKNMKKKNIKKKNIKYKEYEDKDFKSRWISSLVIFLLPVISYCILGPLEIFYGNQKDFVFGCIDFFPYLCGMAIIIWLIGSAMIALLPMKIGNICNVLIFSIGVLSYLQNMFMNTKLSEEDGSPMRWDELGAYPAVNLIVWIILICVIIGISIAGKKIWKQLSMGVAAFLCAIQMVAVISLLVRPSAETRAVGSLCMVGDDQFKIAKEDNIIIFVFDTYGSTRFETALDQYPEVREALSDFVYYNNADCHYYCTFPSMTHMLTGMNFDFATESSQGWMEAAWNSEKAEHFYDAIKEEGYTWNLYSSGIGYVYGNCDNLYGKIDNVREMDIQVNRKALIALIEKMSVYRYVPYKIKPKFEVLTQEFENVITYKEGETVIDDNGLFFQTLSDKKLSIKKDMEKAVIVQHLFGLHAPYTIDENANIIDEATPEQTARGLMTIANEYLQQLKDLGKYDDSTIIITADHGAWFGGDSQPIFLIKEKNESHEEMQIRTAPISSDDFQATIIKLLGKDYTEYGTSIYDWKDGDIRERQVYMPLTDENYPNITGSSFNVYYGYTYTTDGNELNQKIVEGDYEVLPATPW